MSLASLCADITTAIVGGFGAQVTITRRAATAGGTPTSTTVYCMVQPMTEGEYSSLRLEGDRSANEEEPHRFIFPPGTDVVEAIDTITHNGERYRVAMQDEQTLGSTVIVPFAIGVRI